MSNAQTHPTPYGHMSSPTKRREYSSHIITLTISTAYDYAYAMMATLESTIRRQNHTLMQVRGTAHAQIFHIQFKPHSRNILSRTYPHLFSTQGT